MKFEEGTFVLVSSPDNFSGDKVGVVLDKQKWCKDGIAVRLIDEREPLKNLCIMAHVGDTIKVIPKKW